jgi:hypothetical protein
MLDNLTGHCKHEVIRLASPGGEYKIIYNP